MNENTNLKLVITGAAGLVGRNLIFFLQQQGFANITAIDKNVKYNSLLQKRFPKLRILTKDLSEDDLDLPEIKTADILIILHAQISGYKNYDFEKNTIKSTARLIDAFKIQKLQKVILVSTTAFTSKIQTPYGEAKRKQEDLVKNNFQNLSILRPTILIGKDDHKHFAFLRKLGAFFHFLPLPGEGDYVRQPLYVEDLCRAILCCLEKKESKTYTLTGPSVLSFYELLQLIFKVSQQRVWLCKVPLPFFKVFFSFWTFLFPRFIFTNTQLDSLVINESFVGDPWDEVFGFPPTPLEDAIRMSFGKDENSYE